MRAVHVAVLDFFRRGGTHVDHRQVETQGHAGQRMVTVEHHLVVRDFGHGEDGRLFVAAFGHALELHADFERLGQAVALLDLDQVRIVVAERVFRFDLDGRRVAPVLAVQLFFDLRPRVLVAAVQVDHRLGAVFDQVVLGVGQFIVHRHNGVLGNLHCASFRG